MRDDACSASSPTATCAARSTARIDVQGPRMREVMTRTRKRSRRGVLAAEAVHLMETHASPQLLVVDETGVLVGALNVHDLLRAGVM